MPGVTSLGIRYPVLKEVIDAADFQALADDIDTATLGLDVKRTLALKRPSARVFGSSTSVPVATDVDLTYDLEVWDTASLANLGANNDRLTLSAGIWLVQGVWAVIGYTTCTSSRLLITLNSTVNSGHRVSNVGSNTFPYVRATGLVINPTAGGILRLQARWTGTGGPLTAICHLQALRIREL